jgi:hypothetical protein
MYEFSELSGEIKNILTRSKLNHSYCCCNLLKIATKTRGIEPFVLNNIQLDLLNFLNRDRHRRLNILKARQFGVSTFVESWIFSRVLFNYNRNAYILSHQSESAGALFDMIRLFYDQLPRFVKMIYPKDRNNSKIFHLLENRSQITVGTAGGKEVGRGMRNNYVHGSEVAFWDKPDLILSGLIQSVADDEDNRIIFESTANGNNFFREIFEEGLRKNSDSVSLFYGWHQFSEYSRKIENRNEFHPTEEELNLKKAFRLTNEQLNWRRQKIQEFKGREKLFSQEYPLTWQEAFVNSVDNTLLEPIYIYRAAENDLAPSDLQPIVVGIDPARDGGDRTIATVRQGRKILRIFVLLDKTAPEIEGFIIHSIINEYHPDRIFIDLGYGKDIADHLNDLGYRTIEAIAFNGTPSDRNRFTNLRSEIHEKCREWFRQEGGVDIPNSPELLNELSLIPDMRVDALGRLHMVSKDEIRELNRGRSPDYMDSLCLTFARPVLKRAERRQIEFFRN